VEAEEEAREEEAGEEWVEGEVKERLIHLM
jgi:hypothetical protein